jgi:DNA-binding PadR family transcriptional regulator
MAARAMAGPGERRDGEGRDGGAAGGHPADWGRFSDPALLILVSLAGGPKHGYAMTQDIERIAEVKLGPGTLYGALTRLEEHGFIEPLPAEDRRRPYRLTDSGAAMLRAQLVSLETVVTTGQRRLAPSPA